MEPTKHEPTTEPQSCKGGVMASNSILKFCKAGADGECDHPNCPVTPEREKNGEYCDLPWIANGRYNY